MAPAECGVLTEAAQANVPGMGQDDSASLTVSAQQDSTPASETLPIAIRAPPNLPGMQLVDPDLSNWQGQIIYLDFDGERDVTYRGPVTVGPFDIPAFRVPGQRAGREAEIVCAVTASLNEVFAGTGIVFTSEKPQAREPYSTVYIGGDGSAFAGYGAFLGVAEQADAGNRDSSDQAFVFTIPQTGAGVLTRYAEALTHTIVHEVGHLLGYAHEDQVTPGSHGILSDVAAGTTYVVDSLADAVASDGELTLREAIQAANTNAAVGDAPAGVDGDMDIIRFGPSLSGRTIVLAGSQLAIEDDVRIEGPTGRITIDGGGMSRVFSINRAEVTLQNLVMTGGRAMSYGGGLSAWDSTLSLDDCRFFGNGISFNDPTGVTFAGVRCVTTATRCEFGKDALYFGSASGASICLREGTTLFDGCIFDTSEGVLYSENEQVSMNGCLFRGAPISTYVMETAGGRLLLQACTVQDYFVDSSAPAVRIVDATELVLRECIFVNNRCSLGLIEAENTPVAVWQGIFSENGPAECLSVSGHLQVHSTQFLANRGLAIACSQDVVLDGCLFQAVGGAEVSFAVNGQGDLEATNCQFLNYYTAIWIYVTNWYSEEFPEVSLDTCTFASNKVGLNGLLGNLCIENCAFTDNGVGITARSTDLIVLTDCRLLRNETALSIGQRPREGAGACQLHRCLVQDNGRGVAISYDLADSSCDSVELTECSILDNSALGIDIEADSVMLNDCQIKGNTGEGNCIRANLIELTDCRLLRNETALRIDRWLREGASSCKLHRCLVQDNGKGVVIARHLADSSYDSVELMDCSILANSAVGIDIQADSVKLKDCRIKENTGEGNCLAADAWDVTGCEIVGNSSSGPGGGLTVAGQNVVLQKCTIEGNQCEESGGGIWCSAGSVDLRECVVSQNIAKRSGGGICSQGSIRLEDVTVTDNEAGGSGGGLCAHGSTLIITTIIANNTGGGVHFGGDLLEVQDSDISGNTSDGRGGGLWLDGGTIRLTGSTVSGNTAVHGGGAWLAEGVVETYGGIAGNRATCPATEDDPCIDGEKQGHPWHEHNFPQDTPEDPGVAVKAIILPLSALEAGTSVTIDGSSSLNAQSWRWDLDNDGIFDDGMTATLSYSYEQLLQGESHRQPLKPGPNTIGLEVTGANEQTDRTTATLLLITHETPDPEWFARVVAYERNPTELNKMLLAVGYRVEQGWENSDGFWALGLKSTREEPDDPLLVFCGTNMGLSEGGVADAMADVMADLYETGVGYQQFEHAKASVEEWLLGLEQKGEGPVDFIGHSLGGALAQWFAADWTGTNHSIGDVFTFNSPGISEEYADKFKPQLAQTVTHHIVSGDVVSLAGEAFILGQGMSRNLLYSYYDAAEWNPLKLVMGKHLRPMIIEEACGRSRPDPRPTVSEVSGEVLNSAWFFYTDRTYLAWLAGLTAASYATMGSLDPGRLFFRRTTEELRKSLGKEIYSIFGDAVSLYPQGTCEIKRIPLPGPLDLTDIKIAWDLEHQRYTVGLSVEFAKVLTLGGQLMLANGHVDGLSVEASGINSPIGATGLFLQSIHGGVYNITSEDPAAILLQAGATVSFGPQLTIPLPAWLGEDVKAAILTLSGTLQISLSGFALEGKVDLAKVQDSGDGLLATGMGKAVLNLDNQFVSLDCGLELLAGLVSGSGHFELGHPGNAYVLHASGTGMVRLPDLDLFDFLAGTTVGSGEFDILCEITGTSLTGAVTAGAMVDLPFVGMHKVGFRYDLGTGESSVTGLDFWSDEPSQMAPQRLAFSLDDSGRPIGLLAARWHDPIGDSLCTLILPDGTQILESDLGDWPDIERVDSLCRDTCRVYAIRNAPADLLDWSVNAGGVAAEHISAFTLESVPELMIDTVAVENGNRLALGYTATGIRDDATVWAFANPQAQADGAFCLGCLEDGADAVTVTNIPEGDYYLQILINDGTDILTSTWTEETVHLATAPSLQITDGSGLPDDGCVVFPSIVAGTPRTTVIVATLTNRGSAALEIVAAEVTCIDPDAVLTFILPDGVRQTPSPCLLQPGQSVQVQLVFYCPQPGPKHVQLCLMTNDAQHQNVELTAYGSVVRPVSGAPEIAVLYQGQAVTAEGFVNVGKALPGLSSFVFPVRNDGDQDLVLGDLSLSVVRGSVSVTGADQTSLGPGDSAILALMVNADSVGPFECVLSLDNSDGDESPFLFTVTGSDEAPPDQPSCLSPSNGAADASLTPILESSVFSHPEGHEHQASHWQVDDNSDFSSAVWDYTDTDADKISQAVPAGLLVDATSYHWRVRYQDGQGAWSEWSVPSSFTTGALQPYHAADLDQDEAIGDFELLDYIDLWVGGQVGDFELLDTIDLWVAGQYHWDEAAGKFQPGQSLEELWSPLPDLPESKEQFGFEACAGKLYAVAGVCQEQETASCFAYDTDTGQWEALAPLPKAVQSPCLRAVGDRLFCFGGYDHRAAVKYADVWLYDPDADAWVPRRPMPVPREDAGSAVVDGKVWIIGGLTNPGHTLVAQIDVYDPDLDAWGPSFTLEPPAKDWPGRALGDFACAANDTVWCLAGTETVAGYPSLQPDVQGFFTNSTDPGYLAVPDPRCYAELEVIGDELLVVGGCRTSTRDYAETMLVLDLATQTWKDPVRLPYGARGQGVCAWNGVLYVAGGYDGQTRDDFSRWIT
ncbi:MAG: hypothetical protein MUC88_18545 [Planctomycetes bacterium]|nr:hypothetical protein [Planctomycetota bacterium]